jgi:uncharacterized protein (TIGR00255 family)
MPYSMTGFATAELSVVPFRLTWEIRSVNHRYLDLSFRLPDDLRKIEPECRERIAKRIRRGKLDCTLKVQLDEDAAPAYDIDVAQLIAVGALEEKILESLPDAGRLSVADVLRWSGVVREPSKDYSKLGGSAMQCFDQALTGLEEARQSEGGRIAGFVRERCRAIIDVVDNIKPLLDGAGQRYREKLLERLTKLDIEAQPERLEQELALIAQRLDVSEEVDRLVSHVFEIESVLERDEPIGRRLDFLMQELNREANTLSSKSPDEALTRLSVDLKVLIEQMREQVQNLE